LLQSGSHATGSGNTASANSLQLPASHFGTLLFMETKRETAEEFRDLRGQRKDQSAKA
jgi:hypothetical protein